MNAKQFSNHTFRSYLSMKFDGHALEEFMERDDTQTFLDSPLFSRVKALYEEQHEVLDEYEDSIEHLAAENYDQERDELIEEMLYELIRIQ